MFIAWSRFKQRPMSCHRWLDHNLRGNFWYLYYLFRGICGGDAGIMEDLIPPLVSSYVDLYNKQKTLKRLKDGKKDEFFGLRDFYR